MTDKELNPITQWLSRIDQYETAHENKKISLTRDEIVQMIETRLGELNDEMQSLEPKTIDRSIVWFEFTMMRRVYDDLLGIPNEVRPWLTNPEKWDEVRERARTWHLRESRVAKKNMAQEPEESSKKI
jgi:hypothetical protein